MNSITLSCSAVKSLEKTEGQVSIIVNFGGGTMRVKAQGKAAEESATVEKGEYLIVSGRLEMDVLETNGSKEKRAKISAYRIQRLAPSAPTNPTKKEETIVQPVTTGKSREQSYHDIDDIPF